MEALQVEEATLEIYRSRVKMLSDENQAYRAKLKKLQNKSRLVDLGTKHVKRLETQPKKNGRDRAHIEVESRRPRSVSTSEVELKAAAIEKSEQRVGIDGSENSVSAKLRNRPFFFYC